MRDGVPSHPIPWLRRRAAPHGGTPPPEPRGDATKLPPPYCETLSRFHRHARGGAERTKGRPHSAPSGWERIPPPRTPRTKAAEATCAVTGAAAGTSCGARPLVTGQARGPSSSPRPFCPAVRHTTPHTTRAFRALRAAASPCNLQMACGSLSLSLSLSLHIFYST